VSELCANPIRIFKAVAKIAVGRETGRNMIWISSSSVIILMTTNTLDGSADVTAFSMAVLAIKPAMNSGKRETAGAVTKLHFRAILPRFGRMAHGALSTKLALMRIDMASSASIFGLIELEYGVAGATGNANVATHQRERRRIVLERHLFGNRFPGSRDMALITCHIETAVGTRLNVVGQ